MQKIAILIETRQGKIKPTIQGVITAAQAVGHELFALVCDDNADRYVDQLAPIGIHKLVAIKLSDPDASVNMDSRAGAIIEAMDHFGIHTLFALTSLEGKDLLPRIAARLDAPLVMDCLNVDLANSTVEKSMYSGKTVARIRVSGTHRIFGIRPNVIDPEPVPAPLEVIPFEYDDPIDARYEIKEVREGQGGGIDLSEADIIISGGRGMQNGENFQILHECAEVIGAAVGASRVAVDSGWVPHSMQVGQTGTTVYPKLYMACGISGSVQHFAGMKTSGTIVSINMDPDAAMMQNCDYGIVGDLFEIVPILTDQLKVAASDE